MLPFQFKAPRMRACFTALILLTASVGAQQPVGAPPAPLGTPPPAELLPRSEFAFEFRVTLAPAVVVGETAFGRRQYIPITGGTIAGPKFTGEIIPGGWDYQLSVPGGCSTLTADYFVRATDGTVIHILNDALMCGMGGPGGERSFFRPRFDAPKGPHEWLNRATFVATLEMDRPATPPAPGTPPSLGAIRIKFYQIK